MAHHGGDAKRRNGGAQPVPRLGVMGDAVEEFVGAGADMVIDEMRQGTVQQLDLPGGGAVAGEGHSVHGPAQRRSAT